MSDLLSNQEMRRYSRQMMLPEIGLEGQEKLKKARVLVVGAGGLGTPALLYLAATGVGEIGIADNDLVDESNLQRQILYGSTDLGKQKAIIAKQRLEALNHLNRYNIHVILINRENASLICDGYDVLLDATDNYASRYCLDEISRETGIPMISGSLYKYEAQIAVFNYNGSPGITDLYPKMPGKENAAIASELGIPGILPGIAGTLMAAEALKIITGIGDVLAGKVLVYNLLNSSSNIFSYPGKS
jgi:sulfur-carrier protein adenylyltransferase/sulfurtransferase